MTYKGDLTKEQMKGFIGQHISALDGYGGSMIYPIINQNQIITDVLDADDVTDSLTLDEELQAYRPATKTEYSHGCRHEWQSSDYMSFDKVPSGETIIADVFCDKCNYGALIDENGNVIENSIAPIHFEE
jgi:hypothetical protein